MTWKRSKLKLKINYWNKISLVEFLQFIFYFLGMTSKGGCTQQMSQLACFARTASWDESCVLLMGTVRSDLISIGHFFSPNNRLPCFSEASRCCQPPLLLVFIGCLSELRIVDSVCNTPVRECLCQSSGAVWESRWPSWAFRPNEPCGFRGRKAILNHAHALVSACA